MNVLLMVIGVCMIGATGWLLLRAATLPRLRLELHLRQLESYGIEVVATDGDLPPSRGRLDQGVNQLARGMSQRATRAVPMLVPLKRGELTAAGIYSVSPEIVHGYRLLAAMFLPVLVFLYATVLTSSFSIITIVVLAAAVAAGWQLPAVLIRQRGAARLSNIDRELPELIDLLVATIEAGLGLGGSLSLVAGRFEGPLGEELRLTLKQQALGISNEAALGDMVERVDTPAVRSFVRTVIRADKLGVSIGPIMRNLATDMRRRRRQAANEKIQKTPLKMLFPLIFLIFPALFIVLLYPAAVSIMQDLGGLGGGH
jgi:pilus assembly protein TadC